MSENKFLLNEHLGIFMHFESIFFIFLNLENGLFQTHPPTKSGKFQIFFFLNPSLKASNSLDNNVCIFLFTLFQIRTFTIINTQNLTKSDGENIIDNVL